MPILRVFASLSRSLLLLPVVSFPLAAQSNFRGSLDRDVVKPHFSGHQAPYEDAGATAELQANLQSTNLTNWAGMQAEGTVTESGATDSLPATYSMLPLNRMKLDITHPKGHYVLKVNGLNGSVQYQDASTDVLTPAFAVAGIAGFDVARAVLSSPDDFSVVDDGAISIAGLTLRRISIERVLTASAVEREKNSVLDCYFDPKTHLLQKTASVVTLPRAGRQRFLRVISYGDYRTVGAMTIPFSISETLNGLPTWTLSISSIDTTNVPSDDAF
jgi:hypothetical protein